MSLRLFKLSVIVPVFNEKKTVLELIECIQKVEVPKEIIIVDDGSSDGTREILGRYALNTPDIRVIFHDENKGKGSAVRTGIRVATGDAIIIQDADLEYDPRDYRPLLEAMEGGKANVIYGSRFIHKTKVTAFWHRFVNYFLTGLANYLYSAKLTDMETCYKLFRTEILKDMEIVSQSFEIEVELTAKVLKKGERIFEVPISYKGRSYHEGKKIGWRDGVKALWALLRYRFGP